jgi:hypothetical protein
LANTGKRGALKMTKVKTIGIIAEDESDFNCARILIQRIIRKNGIGFKKSIGNGCGKIRKKALDYSEDLKNRGCTLLIFLQDLDRNDLDLLHKELNDKLRKGGISNYFICIPIEEIEAWLLSDPQGIQEALKLKKAPNVKHPPETITSPKEKLEELVSICSNKEKVYLNTKHNEIIASKISIGEMSKKCPSFNKFHAFIAEQTF